MPNLSNESFPIRRGNQRDWIDPARYSVVQRFFLGRLERLSDLRRSADPRREPWQSKLVDHAIYSTYRDCVVLGLEAEAKTVLRGHFGNTPQGSASA